MVQVKNEIQSKQIDLSVLKGKKAIRNIVPYPPGVPYIKKNDLFTDAHLAEIMQQLKNNVKIEGLEDTLDYYTER
ncbi:hypothetical protein ACFQY0_21360 [Haloferula chungangensis]